MGTEKKEKKSNLLKMIEREEKMVKEETMEFFPDGTLASFISTPDKDPFTQTLSIMTKNQATQTFTEEQMVDKCLQIRNNVKESKPENIEINFVEGIQRCNGRKYELGSTVVKVRAMNTCESVYLHIKKGDKVDSLVFIGGNDAQAFLVTKDENNKNSIIRLEEFHLLSISENSTPEKEIGLMVSYLLISAKVYSSIIMGYNLDPVKNLLLADCLCTRNSEKKNAEEDEEDNDNECEK